MTRIGTICSPGGGAQAGVDEAQAGRSMLRFALRGATVPRINRSKRRQSSLPLGSVDGPRRGARHGASIQESDRGAATGNANGRIFPFARSSLTTRFHAPLDATHVQRAPPSYIHPVYPPTAAAEVPVELIRFSQANSEQRTAHRAHPRPAPSPLQLPSSRIQPGIDAPPSPSTNQPALSRTRATSPSNTRYRLISHFPLSFRMPSGTAHHHPQHAHHRTKRPFQPSITSYFAPCDASPDEDSDDERYPGPTTRAHSSASRLHHSHQQHHNHLPGSVQADLLSVGMRVRKSVPEGYKTHKTGALPTIHTSLTRSPNGSSTMTTTTTTTTQPREPVAPHVQHQRELLPFCGLQKIGGYAEQPVTNVHLYGGADASGVPAINIFPLPAEAFTQPFSSQSSTDSSISNSSVRPPNPTNMSKRSWQDEDEPVRLNSNFFFKIPMKVAEDEVPISPLSATPPPGVNFPQAPLRPFAQPRTRRSGLRAMDVDGMVVKDVDSDMDLENADQEGRVRGPGDFDEAEFLRPWPVSREVDMGGI